MIVEVRWWKPVAAFVVLCGIFAGGVLVFHLTCRRTEIPQPGVTMEGLVGLAQVVQQAHRIAEDLEKKRAEEVGALRGIVAALVMRGGGNLLLTDAELQAAKLRNIQGVPEAGNLRLFVVGMPAANSGAADAGRKAGSGHVSPPLPDPEGKAP